MTQDPSVAPRYRRLVFLAFVVSSCAPPVASQITTTVHTAGGLRASAACPGGPRSVAPGTDLTAGVGLSVGCSAGPGACSTSASVAVAVTANPTQPRVQLTCTAFPPGLGCVLGLATASGDVVVTWSAVAPVTGRVVVRQAPPAFFFVPNGTVSVDVEADGTAEFRSGGFAQSAPGFHFEAPLTVDAAGVQVAVDATSQFATMDLVLEFLPGPGVLAPYGSGCGARLTGWYVDVDDPTLPPRVRSLDLRAAGAPGAVGFLVFGDRSVQVPVPPLGCAVRTTLLAPVPVVVGAMGEAYLTVPLPVAVRGGPVYAQYMAGTVAPGGTRWETSNGLALRIP
ncbi:MAG: hypothetical protein AAF628_37595 [Planctomycetota bacterium]